MVLHCRAAYTCGQDECSSANGYDRADVTGCTFFCYFNVNGDESLLQDEFQSQFVEGFLGKFNRNDHTRDQKTIYRFVTRIFSPPAHHRKLV